MSGMLFYVRSLKWALCADALRRFLSIASSIYSEFICKVSLSDCFFETHFGICAGSPSAELHICDLNHYMMLLLVAEAQWNFLQNRATVVWSSNQKRHVWESILCLRSIVSTEHWCAATISQNRSKISVWNLEWREPMWRFPRGKFRNGRPIKQSELACLGCYFTFDL